MPSRSDRLFRLARWLAAGALALAVVIDRHHWAEVSQWREDQATDLWLGYAARGTGLPVGLLSSTGLPNPNGMPLLGAVLSLLPSLAAVSTFLGLFQAIAIVVFCWTFLGDRPIPFWTVLLVLLSSVRLRGVGVEFCNHWVLTPFILLFLVVLLRHLRSPSWAALPLFALLALVPVSLYLGGLVESVVFAILSAAALALRRPKGRAAMPSIALTLCVLVLAAKLTWVRFFRAVPWSAATSLARSPLRERLPIAALAVVTFPRWIFQWARLDYWPLLQSHRAILDPAARRLGVVTGWIERTQAALLLVVLVLAAGRFASRLARRPSDGWSGFGRGLRRGAPFLLVLATLLLSYAVSPLVGGPDWAHNERLDAAVRLLPLETFLIVSAAWFLLPDRARVSRVLRAATIVLAVALVVTSSMAGWAVVRSHLGYRGAVLSDADVPLLDKERAIDFVAQDWLRSHPGESVSVEYRVAGRWESVRAEGATFGRWYPDTYTIGRSYDYDLLRRFGLHNRRQGPSTDGPAGPSRYVLSYAFAPAPEDPPGIFAHHLFGRLRVSVRDVAS